VIGHGMAAPTIFAHGTAEQKRRWLQPLFTGREVWCQLFSEPGSGSDLASASCRAEPRGDGWVVTGQKVWTSVAHLARWGIALVRTGGAPRHGGLTYLVVDMEAPGVSVRPLMQITGEAEFNEVFLDGVFVPDAHRLGGVGDGWAVARTTLMSERVSIGGSGSDGESMIGHALGAWASTSETSAARRDALSKLWMRSEALRLTNVRLAGEPGPEGSVAKLGWAALNQEIAAFVIGLLGPEGQLKPGGYPMERSVGSNLWVDAQQGFLRSRANSIEGGTSEILRNILGEQVLGLPREPRPTSK
jgi:alkylation response protein AidB-like acyl-CoA dehydrogenase